MRMFSFCKNDSEGVRKDGSCEGKPELNDQVASEGMKSIGNVGSGFGGVQHGSRLNKILRQI